MFDKIKQKAKEKRRHYAVKLLGPSSSELVTAQSSSVSISDTGTTNTSVPTPVILETTLDRHALLPPGTPPQVAPIAAPQSAAAAAAALPSADAPPPASRINHHYLNSPAVQDLSLNETAPSASITPLGTGRSDKSTAWSGLKTLLDLLNASADAFGPLKSAVGGILKFIEINNAKAEAGRRYKKLHCELDALFRDLSGYLDESMPPTMKSSLDRLTRGIGKEVGFVLGKEDRSWIKRAAEAMEDADEILECYRQIQRLLERFLIDASVSTWKIVYEQATERRLEKLSPSLAAQYGSAESTDLRRNACTSGTRVDVLEKLKTWAEDGESERIYWLNGMAGTGKTTIAFSFCDQLKSSQSLSASFFCSRQLETCRNANFIMPTVAYQLARFSHPFRYYLSKALENNPDTPSLNISEQFQKLVFEPLLKAEEIMPPGLVVVIDALDECGNKGGVGQILRTLISHAPKLRIKFFVASRPEPWIFDPMQVQRDRGVSAELRLHELDELTVRKDIRRYMKANLEPAMLTDVDFERLVQQSGVLFIYAATVVRYISDDNFSRSAKRLKLVLSAYPTLERGSDHMIGVLYTGILQAAFDDALDPSDREEMIRVLHTIMCAQEPMETSAVGELLGFDSHSVQAALRPLRSVLHISEPSGVIVTLHKSFPDYMFDRARSQKFYCDAQGHNALLAQECFNLIQSQNPPFNICGLESSYFFDKDVPNVDHRIQTAISKGMFYACQYWSAHLRLTDLSPELLNALHELLSVRLLLWMEVMNLKGCTSAGVKALDRLQAWLQVDSNSANIRELARDAWMFASAFSESPMSRSTPHIYVSALPFWPDRRPVSKSYVPKIQGTIRVTGTAVWSQKSEPLAVNAIPSEAICAAYSFDNTHAIPDYPDQAIRIRDACTSQMVYGSLRGHSSEVYSVGFSHDGTRIVSSSNDRNIRIWDADEGHMIGEPLEGHTSAVFSVKFSHDGTRLVSGSADNTIRIWDAQTGQLVGEPLKGHTGWVYSVEFSHNDTRIVSGSYDKTICIWDVHTGQMVGEPLQGHTNSVFSVSYSHDGTRIVSGSADNTIRIWDAETGQMIGEPLNDHTSWVRSVAYSHDGTHIVSGSDDNTVRVWDAYTGQTVGEPLEGHTKAVCSVAFSHNSTRIVSGSYDSTIRIWDAETGEMVGSPLKGHTKAICSVGFSPDSKRIVSGSVDHVIRIWHADTSLMVDRALGSYPASGNAMNQIARSSQLAPDALLPSSSTSSNNPTTRPHVDWAIDDNGWVHDHSQLLIWVPPEVRGCLLCPHNLLIMSTGGSWALDFSNAQLGENWHSCYRAEPALSIQ